MKNKIRKAEQDVRTLWQVLVHFAQFAVGIYGVFAYYDNPTDNLNRTIAAVSAVLLADAVIKFVKLYTRKG